jgi:hypothetical protein
MEIHRGGPDSILVYAGALFGKTFAISANADDSVTATEHAFRFDSARWNGNSVDVYSDGVPGVTPQAAAKFRLFGYKSRYGFILWTKTLAPFDPCLGVKPFQRAGSLRLLKSGEAQQDGWLPESCVL